MPRPDLSEVGLTGLNQYAGTVQEEYLLALRGKRAMTVYREMGDNDPITGALLFTIDMLSRQVRWHVDPAIEDDPAAIEVAEYQQSCLDDMSTSWADTISQIMSMPQFGFSFHEIVYKERNGEQVESDVDAAVDGTTVASSKYDDGRWGWRKLPIRAQETLAKWEFDDAGGIKSFVQQAPPQFLEVPIPLRKGLLFRTRSQKGNPEGRSMLRNAYRPWFFKKRIEEIEGVGIERDLAGLPVGWVPPEWLSEQATSDQRATVDTIAKIVTNIKRDEQEGVIFPLQFDEHGNKLFDLTLMSTGGRRQFDTDAIISRYDQRQAMVMMGDFILLGHEKVGSYSLGLGKMELFAMGMSTLLDEVASVFNAHAFPRLMRLNAIPTELWGTLKHEDIEKIDLDGFSVFVERLAKAGMPMFPDEALEAYIRDKANMPARDAEQIGDAS